jgi:RNA polymerase sigma-70 factor (ECF subfamily)
VFPNTRWTLVLAAGQGDAEAKRAALESLLTAYWRPVYVFLRRKGLRPVAAEDAVQGLFLRLLERDAIARLDRTRGRFRSYLLTALEHYLVNRHEHDAARKRGGGERLVALETLDVERDLPAVPDDPARAFDREWALAVMERALARREAEYAAGRRKGSAQAMLRFFRLDQAPSHAQAAAECGMTPSQFKAALHRARERFRAILREEVADTVPAESDGADELRSLFQALSA